MHAGEYIRRYRLAVGYGLREFASEIGAVPATWCAFELGQRNPKNIDFEKVALVLGMSPTERETLFGMLEIPKDVLDALQHNPGLWDLVRQNAVSVRSVAV